MVPGKTHKTGRQTFMSEPLTSHEIEDVLSSIRRLVSEDLRPARPAAPAAPEAKAPAAAPEVDKLLLTPALRVVPEKAPEAEAPAEADAASWPEPETSGLADLSAGAAPAADIAYEAEPAEAAPSPIAAFSPPQEVYDDAGMEDAAPPAFMGGEDEIIWASAGEVEDATAMVEDLVEPPADPAPPRGHWTAQDLPGSVNWVQEETDWVETDPIPFVAHPRKPDPAAEPMALVEPATPAAPELAARIAEVVMPPAPEPEAELDDPGLGETAEDTAAQGLFGGEELRLDEEKLREIVRDIIREELAGTLGERITRNVRKLVRVEINRALAAREFE